MATRAAVSVAQLQARRQRPWPLRSDGTWLWLATAALLSLSLCASSSLLSVSARAVPTSVVGSVNVIYLATMQQVTQTHQHSRQCTTPRLAPPRRTARRISANQHQQPARLHTNAGRLARWGACACAHGAVDCCCHCRCRCCRCQSLQAYQVSTSTPEFNRTTFTPTSGLDAGAATLTDGLADFAVTTSSVPDALAAKYPNLRAYPFMTTAMSPGYNLPSEVGSATLVLTPLTMCRITRGNITHWSAAEGRKSGRSGAVPSRVQFTPESWCHEYCHCLLRLHFSISRALALTRHGVALCAL